MNPFPSSGFTAGGPSDTLDQQAASDQVPQDFSQYITLVLWKAGVNVSQIATMYPSIVQALWEDPFLQQLFQSNYVGTYTTDPSTGIPITDSNFESAINNELFDPTKTHSQFLLSQGVQLLTLSGRQLTSAQQTYAQNLGGTGDPAVLQAIAKAAQDTGVPYNVALAVAMAESGLNPKNAGDFDPATGKNCSYGLFQLNTCGGEGQGMSMSDLLDPYTNAVTALRKFAAVAQADPSVTSDPGRWAAAAQQPKDPTLYAQRVNNLLQSGFGGSPSSLVPKPFDGNYPVTKDFGAGGFGGTEEGIDYGTPVGTALYTPFAGTIRLEDGGKGGWGKRVMVVLDNGYTFAIGHMTSFSVADGEKVNSGALLGLSGGDPSDPSSGVSDGPHVEVQWISPGNNFLDPHAILDSILAGTATFRSLNLSGAASTSGAEAGPSAQDRILGIDPILQKQHPEAERLFEATFGRVATAAELLALVHAAGDNPDALHSYLRTQPSHIKGMSIGVYQDVKGNLDTASQQMFGHAGTDGMVKDLVDAGMMSPTAIQYWLIQMDIRGQMDPAQYQTLYQLNQSAMQGVYGQTGFDPRIASQQYAQAQQAGVYIPPTPKPTGPPPPPPTPGGDTVGEQAFPGGPGDRNQGDAVGGGGGVGGELSPQ